MVQTKGQIPVPFSTFQFDAREGVALSDGFEVRIRAVSPGDEDGLRKMLSRLSRESIHKRFQLPMPRVPEWALAYLTDVDHYDKESLVALVGDEIVGQAMYSRQEASEAEMAIVVEDRWHSKGIGQLLLRRLTEEAVRRKIDAFTGTVLAENRGALRFFSSVLSNAKLKIRNGVYHLYVPLPDTEPVRNLETPGGARRGETRKTAEDEERTMETATFTGTHVTVPSSKPYEQVIRALESVLGEGNSRSFTEMVGATATWDEFVRGTEQRVGKSGFVIFAQIDHGAWMSRVPHDMKGKLYVIGNPLIAKQMLEHVPEVGLYVPVRIYVHEDQRGTTKIDYDEVSPIFERFGNEKVNEVARELDQKLEELAKGAAGC
jgi:uncharacterized protein (DUF302 family)/GNAT superfamily N-acetyltransferase